MPPDEIIKLIQSVLTPDLLSAEQRRRLTGSHPTEGHCYVATEALSHIMMNPGYRPWVISQDNGNTHWFLKHRVLGIILDPTAEQFGSQPVPYHLGRPCGFLTLKPSRRAQIVINRVHKRMAESMV